MEDDLIRFLTNSNCMIVCANAFTHDVHFCPMIDAVVGFGHQVLQRASTSKVSRLSTSVLPNPPCVLWPVQLIGLRSSAGKAWFIYPRQPCSNISRAPFLRYSNQSRQLRIGSSSLVWSNYWSVPDQSSHAQAYNPDRSTT